MKILINYADSKYKQTQSINSWTGKYIGKFDKIYSFGPEHIDNKFIEKNKNIFNYKRGNGLWLWKPYFINKVLSESNEGDIIFYCDSGSFFIRNIDKLIKSIESSKDKIWISDIPLIESCFTKPSCFETLQCDSEEYRYTNQIQATFILLICCEESKRVMKEWLKLCCNYNLISPEKSKENKDSYGNDFFVHREDQSLLSLLCKKEHIAIHRDPSQRGKWQFTYYDSKYAFLPTNHKDSYKTIIFLHKLPKISLWVCIKNLLNTQRLYINYIKKHKKN